MPETNLGVNVGEVAKGSQEDASRWGPFEFLRARQGDGHRWVGFYAARLPRAHACAQNVPLTLTARYLAESSVGRACRYLPAVAAPRKTLTLDFAR